MNYADKVEIVEVGPRDGLQSLAREYSTEQKVEMVTALIDAGFKRIEVTSFVRPDIIPQLADAEALMAALPRREGCVLRTLVPNERGAERAVAAGADEMVGLITASEAYNKKNQNMSIDENLVKLEGVASIANEASVPLTVAIGLAMFCPYEGDIPKERVFRIVERMWEKGVTSYYVATSAGLDGPRVVGNLCGELLGRWPGMDLAVHLHDTNGMALANALAAMDAGVRSFEGSICGIGGGIRMPSGMSPYGNVPTEDLVHMFNECGIETGLDLEDVVKAARSIYELLELPSTTSRALQGGFKEEVMSVVSGAGGD